jgi:hypothetical protein
MLRMSKFNIPLASNKKELQRILSKTPVQVPGRSEGRNTSHTEKWSICHLLSTLSEEMLLSYPLALMHKDKPDFELAMNSKRIGVEITESIPEDYAKCCFIAEKINPNAQIDLSFFKWGQPHKTTAELKKIANQTELTGDGWEGDRPEVEWANFINKTVTVKLKKLRNAGYENLSECWLSIYDNLPLPNVHAQQATEILISNFPKYWVGEKTFSHIYIERGPIIIQIDQDRIATNFGTVDLWP